MDFYDFALKFAAEHWFLSWCALWLAWAPLYLLPMIACRLITRSYRCLMVLMRGWPPAHLDADGAWKPAPEVKEN